METLLLKIVSSSFNLFIMKYAWVLITLFSLQSIFGQSLTGEQLLEKAIQYHDPQGMWPSFQGEFKVILETPNNPQRESIITIDLPQEYFNVSTIRDGKTSFREIKNNNCRFSTEDDTVKEATLGEKDCERTERCSKTIIPIYMAYL